jgi:hypothetical protein
MHGFGAGHADTTVTVNIPPGSGDHRGLPGYAEVIVQQKQSRTFSAVFSTTALDVSARAVAAGTMVDTNASVLVLDPKGKQALKLKGSSSSIKVGGDIIVDSKNKNAVKVDKRNQVQAERLLLSGGIEKKSRKLLTVDVETGLEPTVDPLGTLPPPAPGPSRNAGDYKVQVNGKDTYALEPGSYKELSFDKDDVVTLKPGIYNVSDKVELKNNATLAGSEVMIYNAGKKGIKLQTTGQVTLTPPSSGTYEGVSLFQNGASKSKVELKRSGHIAIDGIIYAPNSQVKIQSVDLTTGGYIDDEEDWEEGDPGEDNADDNAGSVDNSIGASLIAKSLSIEKRARVQIMGTNIKAKRPLRGLVE